MASVAIRKSGGSNIVSIPTTIVKTLGLQVGAKLDLTIKGNSIVLSPIDEPSSLESILEGSPQNCFAVTDEDDHWLNVKPAGSEI